MPRSIYLALAMAGIGLTLAATVVSTTTVISIGATVLALRHRHRERSRALSAALDPMPAGIKHLAASVGELSDLGLHRPAAARVLAQRRRLGVLLGLR